MVTVSSDPHPAMTPHTTAAVITLIQLFILTPLTRLELSPPPVGNQSAEPCHSSSGEASKLQRSPA